MLSIFQPWTSQIRILDSSFQPKFGVCGPEFLRQRPSWTLSSYPRASAWDPSSSADKVRDTTRSAHSPPDLLHFFPTGVSSRDPQSPNSWENETHLSPPCLKIVLQLESSLFPPTKSQTRTRKNLMTSDFMASLQPPRGLSCSETLADSPSTWQKLHLHLENLAWFPPRSVTVMPTGRVESHGQTCWERFSKSDHATCVKESRKKWLLPLCHPELPSLELSGRSINMHASFIPCSSSALMLTLRRTLLVTGNAFICGCLFTLFFFFKAAFKIISLGLIIFYRETNTSPHFSWIFGFSSHLPASRPTVMI